LSIHELLIIPDLAEALNLPWFLHSLWVIPGTIFVLIFAQRYWKFTLHLPKRSRYHFTLAAMLYIGGALGMEMVGSYYAELEGQQHLTYALLTSLEEAMEMMGTVAFIYGLLFYIGQWAQELQVQIKIFET
jgi:predicted permease